MNCWKEHSTHLVQFACVTLLSLFVGCAGGADDNSSGFDPSDARSLPDNASADGESPDVVDAQPLVDVVVDTTQDLREDTEAEVEVDTSPDSEFDAPGDTIIEVTPDVDECMCNTCMDECANMVCQSVIAGEWVGTYECPQGLTGVTLTISGNSADLDATFSFYAHPSNPDVPSGSFSMDGSLGCGGNLVLFGRNWIVQPDGYNSLDITGSAPADGSSLSVDLTEEQCPEFSVARQ